jgi:hypothetical protein
VSAVQDPRPVGMEGDALDARRLDLELDLH